MGKKFLLNSSSSIFCIGRTKRPVKRRTNYSREGNIRGVNKREEGNFGNLFL